ncbi:hypothetical protein RQ832_04490, partial [Roseomonas sp. DSM 102946]|nr:hypothetical protein [Roseomonas sp. DSM 102946]
MRRPFQSRPEGSGHDYNSEGNNKERYKQLICLRPSSSRSQFCNASQAESYRTDTEGASDATELGWISASRMAPDGVLALASTFGLPYRAALYAPADAVE